MKPMLAAKFDIDNPELFRAQLEGLRYPVICSPKVDGIRVVIHPTLGPVTRKLEPVRNTHIRTILSKPEFAGLDGEITIGPPHFTQKHGDVFARTTGAVRSVGGEPDFKYWVFDNFNVPETPYIQRLYGLKEWRADYNLHYPHIKLLPFVHCETVGDILFWEEEWIKGGYEGIMIRDPNAPYKFNRSTLKQGHLIKLKRVEDDEAEIIGVEPRMRNDNEQIRDALGYAKRSSHQSNKTPLGMVGKLICRSPRFSGVFGIGSGFDHATAAEWWDRRDTLLGRIVTFKYQACGTVDLPRHPIFKGFRED